MPLTQVERDIEGYALGKVRNLINDVAQAFDIAGMHKAESIPLLASMFQRLSIQFAMSLGAGKGEFLRAAAHMFDQEVARAARLDAKERDHGKAQAQQT